MAAVLRSNCFKLFKDIGIFGWSAGILWGASNIFFTLAVRVRARVREGQN
jgi:hypothetical protein